MAEFGLPRSGAIGVATLCPVVAAMLEDTVNQLAVLCGIAASNPSKLRDNVREVKRDEKRTLFGWLLTTM